MQTGYGRLRTPVQPVRIQHANWLWQATYTCTTCRDVDWLWQATYTCTTSKDTACNWLWQATYTCTTCKDTACNWLWQAMYNCTTCRDTACRLVMAGYVHLYNLWEYGMQTGYGRLRTPVQPVGIQHANWLWQATYTRTTCRDTACRLVMAGYVHPYNL